MASEYCDHNFWHCNSKSLATENMIATTMLDLTDLNVTVYAAAQVWVSNKQTTRTV